ncbi:Fungal trichothecene efflux pump [Lasiodiplodia theobromae]|uniref:Protein ecm33 n=1 Tax=Lasiodiplodia theobromae TaxID=45133 RepID=A0A5N5DN88_9PEZI|nr:hypothetical protein DBV05_g2538 [Lasiodiplodia theobromae]KAF9638717.1 Fungal trichothecene efflux pump [Lasiodiplodia theobromae]
MQLQAPTQIALLAPAVAAYTSVGPCSWTTTSTIAATATTYTSAPCPTVTGHFAVAEDMEGTFQLNGIEEIQGSLTINGAEKLDRIDLGDLKKLDGLFISSSSVEWDGISWPNLHTVKEVHWAHVLFNSSGNNPKLKGVEDLYLYDTKINDPSDVFEVEAGKYIYIGDNANMKNITLPDLKSVSIALEIFGNAPSVAISFPELKWVNDLLVSGVGKRPGWGGATILPSSLDLPKLVEVKGDLIISDSHGLDSVIAPSLMRVHGNLKVVNNAGLQTMPFENLYSVDGDLVYNGSFSALSGQVRHTIGMVSYETDNDFSCCRHYGSTIDYQGGYYCKSASESCSTAKIALSWTTPTPTPTPTPRGRSNDRLEWWALLIICMIVGAILVAIFVFEYRRRSRLKVALASARKHSRVRLPTVNTSTVRAPSPNALPPPPVYRPRADDADAILPPPVTAMAPPPKYSEAVGSEAEKATLEMEYRNRD